MLLKNALALQTNNSPDTCNFAIILTRARSTSLALRGGLVAGVEFFVVTADSFAGGGVLGSNRRRFVLESGGVASS